MHKTLLMLAAMSCLAGAQLASGQMQPTAGPLATNAMPGDINHTATLVAAPGTTAQPAAATSVNREEQADKKAKKKDDTANMQPDDPRKSPWWEPRDWGYIYNQGP